MIEYFRAVPMYSHISKSSIDAYFLDQYSNTDIELLRKKRLLSCFPSGFMSERLNDELSKGNIEYTTTSGSSGTKLTVMRPNNWWQREFANGYIANPDMTRYKHGRDVKVVLTTAICSGNTCFMNEPSYDERFVNNTLYLNMTQDPNNWTKNEIIRISEEIHTAQPKLIEADPTYLCLFLIKRKEYNISISLGEPQYITCSYEYLTRGARNLIEGELHCPVYNMYGSTELGVLFISDSLSNYHRVSHETILELLPYDSSRGLYNLVVTSWRNPYMPYLRYVSDDLVEIGTETECELLRGKMRFGPGDPLVIHDLHGRRNDTHRNQNNKSVTPKDLDDLIWSRTNRYIQYQLRKSNDSILFLYVRDHGSSDSETKKHIYEVLQDMYGTKLRIDIQSVRYIPADASGKFSLMKNITDAKSHREKREHEQLEA